MELTSGVRVSAHVPVPATNRQNVVIRRGMSHDRRSAHVGGRNHNSR